MAKTLAITRAKKERGMALLLTLFALLLVSAVGLFMVLSSDTEARIDANYGSSMRTYYAARSGLEEVRDRIKYPSSPSIPGSRPWGLADKLPLDIAGNPNGVLYVLNPTNGETIDPTDVISPYFDDDLCHAYNSGTPKGIKCTTVPTVANWQMPAQFSQVPDSGPLNYKWIRINMKTNRTADPYFVDQTGTSVPVDTRVCWDGQAEQLSPSATNPSCDANGMQSVFMLTSLAVASQASGVNGARKMLQAEIVAPSIRPAGALTANSMNLSTSGAAGVPLIAIDGRVHNLDGKLSSSARCSSIAALATNSASQLQQALMQLRKSIVDTANNSCNADGSSQGSNLCSPGLWWVRGTDSATRFVTTTATTTTVSSGSGSDGHDGSGGGGHDHSGSGSGGTTITTACDPTNPSCYTNLNLGAPELFAVSATSGSHVPIVVLPPNATAPFVGNSGNQSDSSIYQPAGSQIVSNQVAMVNSLVLMSQTNPNYFKVSSATLAGNYGSSDSPAIVDFSDSTLSLPSGATLSGYGVLVIQDALEIGTSGSGLGAATLNWTGIVLVKSPTGHVTIGPYASGLINGALLLNPGAAFNFSGPSSTISSSDPFRITYSCDAVDLAFSSLPFKTVSTAETSF